MPLGPGDFTVSGLPRRSLPGGLKVDAVADLLQRAAFDYRAVLTEVRQLVETTGEQRRRIKELEAQAASLEADVAARNDQGTKVIGKALLAATRASEQITAEANASAKRITTQAETHAAAILQQARVAAEAVEKKRAAVLAELELERARLDRDREALSELLERERTRVISEAEERSGTMLADARREAEKLRSLLTDSRRRFEELAGSALAQLEDFGTKSGSNADLLDDLRPQDAEPPRSGVARGPSSTKPPTTV